ncbi:MAG: DUF2203 family protein [Verrucomicrobiae bacterium]|jgi:hypothetical protein|nr:DUF2203 family protein [Verrucomicrobiae bacterium]
MYRRFTRHYTRDEARELLPEIRGWLTRLGELRERLDLYERQTKPLLSAGDDLGGNRVNHWVAEQSEFRKLLQEFESREIHLVDIERGQVHFPTLKGTKEAYLCWELRDDDVIYWRDLEEPSEGDSEE